MGNLKPLAILCGCTARYVADMVGNPEDRFSHNEAQFVPKKPFFFMKRVKCVNLFLKTVLLLITCEINDHKIKTCESLKKRH